MLHQYDKLGKDEVVAFRNACKDDTDAVHVISQANVVVAKFYRNLFQLEQVKEPELRVDQDKAKTRFQKADRSGESGCIIRIIATF